MPKAMNLARIVHRLMTRARGWRVARLREELGIAGRTYRKYRKDLQDHFAPFFREDGTSAIEEVRYQDAKYLRLVDLKETSVSTEDFLSRIAALQLSRLILGFLSDTSVGEALEHVVLDFNQRIRDSDFVLGHLLRNVDRLFYQVPDAPKDYSEKGDILETLLHALVFSHVIEVEYDSASLSSSYEMRLHPYSLISYRSALYLAARCEGYDDVRLYAVDRILRIDELTERFDYPSASEFDPKDYTAGAFGLFRGNGEDEIDFEFIFDDERWLKMYVQERQWTPDQSFEELEDGRLRMTFSVGSDREVWPWVRSFGDAIEVVKPDPPDDL